MTDAPLSGQRIAVPETRLLDVLSGLFERRGADVVRCPLVSILDHPDERSVQHWLQRFYRHEFDDLIVYTGEGLRRLLGFAERAEQRDEYLTALTQIRKIVRGPKPVKVLRELKVSLDQVVPAAAPTTEGLVATLNDLNLSQRQVALQIYGDTPNEELMAYLASRQVKPVIVAPYIYATEAHQDQVLDLIQMIINQQIQVIVFTSQPQWKRLFKVALNNDLVNELCHGLTQCVVAAVGPVVADQLHSAGVHVDVQPESSFFMKPLVQAVVDKLGGV